MMRNIKSPSHKKSSHISTPSQHSTSHYRKRPKTKRSPLPRPSIINLSPKRLLSTSKDSFLSTPLLLSSTVLNTSPLQHSRFFTTLVNHQHTIPSLKPPIFVHHLHFSTLSTPTSSQHPPSPQHASPQLDSPPTKHGSQQPPQQEQHEQHEQQPSTTKIIPIEEVLKEDVVAASIPKPRNSTDQNQYKLGGSSQWKTPTELYQNLSHEERQEIKERFALENHHRMHSAMSRLRSTRGTIAYGSVQASDSMDGSMPQRNGSQSGNVLDAFDRAEKYRQKMAQKKQQSDILDRQLQLKEEQRKEFEFDPRKALELDMGEFGKNSDHLFKREATQDELMNTRLNQLLGGNWASRWF